MHAGGNQEPDHADSPERVVRGGSKVKSKALEAAPVRSMMVFSSPTRDCSVMTVPVPKVSPWLPVPV